MPINNLITFRKGTEIEWSSVNPVLASGEPGWDTDNNILKIGNGTDPWNDLNSVNNNNNIVRGTIVVDESLSNFDVQGGYAVGSLDIFLNGVKLFPGGDYTASNGTSFQLSEPVPSGSVIEYLALNPASSVSTTSEISYARMVFLS